jgi:hypothetical protein
VQTDTTFVAQEQRPRAPRPLSCFKDRATSLYTLFYSNCTKISQFYLLRWVRLLLGREFHSLDDLMIIWDAIFAHSPDLVLVDYICVSMLVFIREQCMHTDTKHCAQAHTW